MKHSPIWINIYEANEGGDLIQFPSASAHSTRKGAEREAKANRYPRMWLAFRVKVTLK